MAKDIGFIRSKGTWIIGGQEIPIMKPIDIGDGLSLN
jgi:hypothetical protein